MKILLATIIILFLKPCCAQELISFDKIPIDTAKWSSTDTIYVDFNKDKIQDIILIFDKYSKLIRPKNIQTPLLFFLGVEKNRFKFLKRADRLILLPDYKISNLNNDIVILQKGIKDDTNEYSCFCRFLSNDIIVYRERIDQIIEKIKIDPNTGKIIKSFSSKSVISDSVCSIPVNSYDFLVLLGKSKKQ